MLSVNSKCHGPEASFLDVGGGKSRGEKSIRQIFGLMEENDVTEQGAASIYTLNTKDARTDFLLYIILWPCNVMTESCKKILHAKSPLVLKSYCLLQFRFNCISQLFGFFFVCFTWKKRCLRLQLQQLHRCIFDPSKYLQLFIITSTLLTRKFSLCKQLS